MDKLFEGEVLLKILTSSFNNTSYLSSESTSSINSLSSDDDEPVAKRKKVVRNRIHLYVENTVGNYSETEFQAHFRMSRLTAYKVIDLLANASVIIPLHEHGRPKITPEKMFLVIVWYLSNSETFRQVSDRFDITMSSAYRCLTRVVKFLLLMRADVIKWPTGERITTINLGFKKKEGIENVLGVIDCSHIEINRPRADQEAYINTKGYPSLLLQAVVDHELRFTDVFCGEPGSIHDAVLLRKSNLYSKMNKNRISTGENFLLGDSAYPNLDWLVTPYNDIDLTSNQRSFNSKICATRVVAENAFGLLKGRFPRLLKISNLNLQLSAELIMVACILHNICLDGDDLIDSASVDYNQPDEAHFDHVTANFNQSNHKQIEVFNKLFNL